MWSRTSATTWSSSSSRMTYPHSQITWLAMGAPFRRRLSGLGLVTILADRLPEHNERVGHGTDPVVRAIRRRDRRAAGRVAASRPARPAAGRIPRHLSRATSRAHGAARRSLAGWRRWRRRHAHGAAVKGPHPPRARRDPGAAHPATGAASGLGGGPRNGHDFPPFG